MSWWSSSSTGADAAAQSQPPPQPPPQEFLSRPETQLLHPPTTPTSPPAPETAPHDPDFYAAHPHLAPSSFSTSSPNTASPTPTDEPLSTHLPRTMSCRAAFDSAFYCSSLGGHFNDIYRYGQLRSCSEHWNDFWFCMRVKNSYNPRETKERMVQERYREKEAKVLSGPSSEDVWRVRREGEGVEGAFGMAPGKEER
ncbi:hypothetical protein CC86DRAFT_367227 [Ophiobolus disseminans]|uniref:Uncharacterized protein n=1 Tax=Ophiobolus disseminans TaxID=1469910 RepID=A0A6A7AAZ3_9PLEO|nr:hypothetical protein CC86DRAFT_367227 [Ophiobolus disseminans]